MKTSLLLLICLLTTNAPAVLQTNSMGVIYDDLVWKQPGAVLHVPPPSQFFTNDAVPKFAAFANAEWSPHPIRQRVVKHTNVTEVIVFETEPCVTYHYYGITFDGGMKEMGKFADHDPLLSGWEGGNFDPSIRFILRSESPASKLCVIRQMEQPNPLARFPPGLHAPFIPIPPLPFPIQQTNHITKN